MKVLKTYDSKVLSEKNNIASLIRDIVKFLCDYNEAIDEDTMFDIKVILNELLQNAMRHGNKEDRNKSIKVRIGIAGNNYAYFIIEDEGEGFNYKCLFEKGFDFDESIDFYDLKESGRGMLIVKSLCEKLKFNEKGNKVIVLKKLS